ncbi:MAG: T9SS type A sorting domain-containing protein [Chitinispirillaceae bacterium]
MGRFKLTALMGIAALSMSLISTARADQLFDDFEDGTNQNEFEYYWYYYDDNAGFGEDDRPLAGTDTDPSVIDVDYETKAREGFGSGVVDPSDDWEVKVYEFSVREEAGNRYAEFPFTLGDEWEGSYEASPYAAIGAMLCADGESIDLTGTEGIKFRIRSHVEELVVRFKIQDYDIDTFSIKPTDDIPEGAFGYHGKNVTTTPGEWEEKTIYWEDLEQPGGWAEEDEFSIDRVTKVAWEVSGENNEVVTDTVDIDDVEFLGDYEYVSQWELSEKYISEDLTLPEGEVEFATFDDDYPTQSPTGYWYAYNDVEIGGTSEVLLGATESDSGLLDLDFVENSGSGGETQGAGLQFTLGKPIVQNQSGGREITVNGFVGVGVNLYDSSSSEYLDATDPDNDLGAEIKSVYFHYKLDGDAEKATLEISDYHDVPDADDPERSESRGSGVVYFVDLPHTEGEWVAAKVPFDSLKYHFDWEDSEDIPLDVSRLAKAQWKVQGGEDLGGEFIIDNIYFTSDTDPLVSGSPVVHTARTVQPSAFRAALVNGNIRISLNNSLTNGTAKLINTRGKVVGTTSFAKNSVANFSTKTLPAGAYFVRVKGIDAKGETVNMQSAVNVVK